MRRGTPTREPRAGIGEAVCRRARRARGGRARGARYGAQRPAADEPAPSGSRLRRREARHATGRCACPACEDQPAARATRSPAPPRAHGRASAAAGRATPSNAAIRLTAPCSSSATRDPGRTGPVTEGVAATAASGAGAGGIAARVHVSGEVRVQQRLTALTAPPRVGDSPRSAGACSTARSCRGREGCREEEVRWSTH